ncbi:MAG: hypothetical protein H6739_04415 [Alphaproteobacteria bacterium]|nr:hypothetical protein [Alphaproteobacteria bacterium]
MSPRILGDFDLLPEGLIPEGALDLRLSAADLGSHWARCALLSDTVGRYVSFAFREQPHPDAGLVFNTVSTVFQELIENAAKFSRRRDAWVDVRLRHYGRVLMLEVANTSSAASMERFAPKAEALFEAEDLEELFIDTLVANADFTTRSGIGLLLLLKDHPVKLGIRLGEDPEGRPQVTTRAFVYLDDLA